MYSGHFITRETSTQKKREEREREREERKEVRREGKGGRGERNMDYSTNLSV